MSSRRKPLIKLTIVGAIDHSDGDERHLLVTDRDTVPACKAVVGKCCYVILCFVSCV